MMSLVANLGKILYVPYIPKFDTEMTNVDCTTFVLKRYSGNFVVMQKYVYKRIFIDFDLGSIFSSLVKWLTRL